MKKLWLFEVRVIYSWPIIYFLSISSLRSRESGHWGQNKRSPYSSRHFQMHFLMKMHGFRLIFHWSLFLWFNKKIPALLQIMAWCWPGDKPLSEPMMFSLRTHICVTRPRWVNMRDVGTASERRHYMFIASCLVGWKHTKKQRHMKREAF